MSSLYKYIADCSAVPFLLRGTVKFTPIPELNDPSELVPNVDIEQVKSSLDRLRSHGYSDEDMLHLRHQEHLLRRLAPRFLAIDVPSTKERATAIIRAAFYDSVPLLERLLNETAQEMSSKVGLFCLSRRFDSLPMWAHYARNAAGLVVEFRGLEEVFRGDETGILAQPVPVRYEREHAGVTFEPQSHESLFFTKFADWSYEQEVRVVLPLSDCRREPVGATSVYLYQVPPERIARLILGWNMDPEQIDAVHAYVRDINPDVAVVGARVVRGRVEPIDPLSPLR